MEESKSPLDTDNTKSSMVSLNKSIMDSEDKGALVEGKDDVPTTLERFWVLFLFCCCIMVNQCGWIQIAPVFLLVEDVRTYFVFLTSLFYALALWCQFSHSKPDVILIHGSLPSYELPVDICR